MPKTFIPIEKELFPYPQINDSLLANHSKSDYLWTFSSDDNENIESLKYENKKK